MVYEVCLHGYTRVNKWSTKFVYMYIHELYARYTNKQMVYEVCLHGYTRINKWFTKFVFMDIHE